MTPREIKEALYEAANTQDKDLALKAAIEFTDQKLWTSSSEYVSIMPDGTEVLIFATRPGKCVLCDKWFPKNTEIRWRSMVNCHPECWDEKFGNTYRAYNG